MLGGLIALLFIVLGAAALRVPEAPRDEPVVILIERSESPRSGVGAVVLALLALLILISLLS